MQVCISRGVHVVMNIKMCLNYKILYVQHVIEIYATGLFVN